MAEVLAKVRSVEELTLLSDFVVYLTRSKNSSFQGRYHDDAKNYVKVQSSEDDFLARSFILRLVFHCCLIVPSDRCRLA